MNGFIKGHSVYTCSNCFRLTRPTNDSNHLAGVCLECWDLGGIDNEIQDGVVGIEHHAETIVYLTDKIVSLGGTLQPMDEILRDAALEHLA